MGPPAGQRSWYFNNAIKTVCRESIATERGAYD
jgi:hypothetical protein